MNPKRVQTDTDITLVNNRIFFMKKQVFKIYILALVPISIFHNDELSEITAGCHARMARPMGFALERFVRPRESARGRTNRASANAQLVVRSRAARPYN